MSAAYSRADFAWLRFLDPLTNALFEIGTSFFSAMMSGREQPAKSGFSASGQCLSGAMIFSYSLMRFGPPPSEVSLHIVNFLTRPFIP
jgi:hypothetical protein